MAIEVTSVSDGDAPYLPGRILARIKGIVPTLTCCRYRLYLQVFVALLILAAFTAGHTLVRSYQYYSRIIDSRLARGYLTSRAGLYAARTILRPGQGVSASDLVRKLQQAGYVEGSTADVWNGSFTQHADSVEIRPTLTHEQINSAPLQVTFDSSGRIKGLTRDGVSLESFTLEPEVLTNDTSTKLGEHRAVTFNQLPPDLVHAILAIED